MAQSVNIELVENLKPFIAREIQQQILSLEDVGITGVHGDLLWLSLDDHPHYLLADGSRNVSGNLSVDEFITIDGVDLDLHVIDPDAHHDIATEGDHISLVGQQISVEVTSDAQTEILTVLVGDTDGRIRVSGIGINVAPSGNGLWMDEDFHFINAHSITTSAGDLAIDPYSEHLLLYADLDLQGPHSITTTTGHLTLDPYLGLIVDGNASFGSATDTTNAAVKAIASNDSDYALYLKQRTNQDAYIFKIEAADTTDALLIITKEGDLESGKPGFVTGTSGWQITHDGHAEFWSAKIRGELHASVFSADEMSATNGSFMVITSGVVDSPTNLPATIGQTLILNIKASVATGLCPFIINDILMTQFMSHGGVGLDVWEIYLEVDAVGAIVGRDLPNDEPGHFPLTCTWQYGGEADLEIPAPLAIVKWGTVGGTGLEGGIVMTADDPDNSPYLQIFTLPSAHTWGGPPVKTPRVHMGNLNGVMALGDEWGIAMAQDLSSTADDNPSVVVGSGGVKLRNVDFQVLDSSSNPRIFMTSTGVVKFGTDTGFDPSTMFHFDPVAGSLALRDTTIKSYNASLQTGEWTSTGEFKLGENIVSVDTTTFHVYTSGSVTIGRYPNGAYMYWRDSDSTLKLYNSQIEIWAAGDGKRHALLNASGYFYLGEDTSTHASISFAHYGEGGGVLSGDVRIGTLASGKANVFWDQSAGTLSIRNNTTPMIVFEGTTGNSFFAGRMDVGSTTYPLGKIVATNTTLDKDGIEIEIGLASEYVGNRGYTFYSNTSSAELGGLYCKEFSFTSSLKVGLDSPSGYHSIISILSEAPSGKYAEIYLVAQTDYGYGVEILLTSETDKIEIKAATFDTDGIILADGDIRSLGGIRAGGLSDVATGTIEASTAIKAGTYLQAPILYIMQGSADGVALDIRSTDITGMGTQGMNSDDTYFQIKKANANFGGALLKGAGKDNQGLWLTGSVNNQGTTYGAVVIQGQTDNTTMAATSKVFQIWNHGNEIFNVRGDGDIYVKNLTHTTFDHLDSDAEMVRALSLYDDPSIHTPENRVRYAVNDLEREKLIDVVDDGYEMNLTNMLKLLMGAAWENELGNRDRDLAFELFGQRLAELEEQVGRLH